MNSVNLRESENSGKLELDSSHRSSLLPVSFWHSGSMLVSYTRDSKLV